MKTTTWRYSSSCCPRPRKALRRPQIRFRQCRLLRRSSRRPLSGSAFFIRRQATAIPSQWPPFIASRFSFIQPRAEAFTTQFAGVVPGLLYTAFVPNIRIRSPALRSRRSSRSLPQFANSNPSTLGSNGIEATILPTSLCGFCAAAIVVISVIADAIAASVNASDSV